MEQLLPLLEKLADKLGTTTEHLWGVLVNQAWIAGVLFTIGGCAMLLFCVSIPIIIKKRLFMALDEDEMLAVKAVGIIIIVALIILIFTVIIPSIITCFYNPEYWALKTVLENIK